MLDNIVILPVNPLKKMPFHYLLHHAVIRQDKVTIKLCIVFDGSIRSAADTSPLIDCLKTSPNLVSKPFNILMKFYWNLIAVITDTEKVFLMIGIHKVDQDMLRFLWFKESTNTDSEVIHLRFTRLVFKLQPSPATLGSVILLSMKYSNQNFIRSLCG